MCAMTRSRTRRTVPIVRRAAALSQPACHELDALDGPVTAPIGFASYPANGERPLRGAQGSAVFVAVLRYFAAASTSASFLASTASSTAYSASWMAACAN
jgi:hypothetical protein